MFKVNKYHDKTKKDDIYYTDLQKIELIKRKYDNFLKKNESPKFNKIKHIKESYYDDPTPSV